jgi:hypothetical protein
MAGAAESGAVVARRLTVDLRGEEGSTRAQALQLLVNAWHDLPDSVRNQILRLANEALL